MSETGRGRSKVEVTRTLRRVLDILEAFDENHRRMTLSEISDRVGLARTTCLRLLQSLEAGGYLVRVSDQDLRYCLSLKVLNFARYVDRTLDVRMIAHQWVVDLAHKTGATVALNMRDGAERVCVDVVLPNAQLMRIVNVGDRLPLPIGAIGRVLTAYCDDNELDRVLERGRADLNIDRIGLRKRLKEIRERGYDIAFGERIAGTTAVAAPIFDDEGKVLHCLSVIGLSIGMDDRKDAIIEELLIAVRKISLQMGYKLTEDEVLAMSPT
jgi:IclR family transcriptional regulator, KDG regulon repressor